MTTSFRGAARRLIQAVAAAWGASLLIWMLLPLAPGDPARLTLGAQGIPEPNDEQLSAMREQLGLDLSLPQQYLHWLAGVVRLDFGLSYVTGRPVTTEFAERLGPTLRLAVAALVLAVALSLVLGLVAARYRDRWPDSVARAIALISASTPGFVVGLVLIQVVVIDMGIGKVVLDGSWSMVAMPAVCLAFGLFDTWSRLLRSNLVEVMDSSVVDVARGRGATPLRALLRHALPHSMPTYLHAVAVGAGAVLGGAAIVETVFTWPGVGAYVVSSVATRDLPVVQAFAMLATIVYVAVNLAADAAAALIDPRLRSAGSRT
ncbi:ABC transporter permease subunit [Rhodococcus hoagii]|nr:ABC transporter permease subunit [Prescottella equi]MBM4528101.1 ABC transporter permease subunit [Prescottella equi]MBM4546201.1 ABC transporter permease subunit [Prescottella equi]MBM4572959.1 ABC transporter permease subunit [Prescottella equi]MBM4606402.1 ABC transporter permease subunit [Prescottella equi]